ncbi:MAG: CvpA family protein [Phycisphaerales bacterium]|nr:CvpA family protein [Phycisphaerales bacterium]
MGTTRGHSENAATPPPSKARLVIAITIGGIALLVIVFGSVPIKIVAGVIALCTLQGLWRGASELIGIVVGMLLAVILCRPVGKVLEPAIASVTATGGFSSRLIATALAALGVAALVAIVIGVLSKRAMKSRPQLHGMDKLAGGGLGLLEGSFLGLLVLWIPLAIEPLAVSQVQRTAEDPSLPRNPVAQAVANFAGEVRQSSLGGVAASSNPLEGAQLFALTADFAAVVRHKPAFDHFLNSPVMTKIKGAPAVQDAIKRLEADPELGAMLRNGNYGAEMVRAMLTSKALLEVFDSTTIVSDLTPLVGELQQALKEARAIADRQK